ncbi:MAG: hypothetical protein J6X91_04040 [Bacteroidales bacterium]|nr:hypothetical protein [Bacteroidales bacterium]
MKKIVTIILTLSLILTSATLQAQRSVKSVKFDGLSLNTAPEAFISKLEKKGWKTISIVNATDSQDRSYTKTTLEGKVNGIEVSATVIPSEDLEKVSRIVMFTDEDQALCKTRYDVIKSWLVEEYGKPIVEDLEMADSNFSCYWGDFNKGERDLQKNHITLITADLSYVVASLDNKETALDATINNVGDKVEHVGDKISETGKKASEKGKDIKEKAEEKAEKIADGATKVSKKAKKIANAAAQGAKDAWQSIKEAVKKND